MRRIAFLAVLAALCAATLAAQDAPAPGADPHSDAAITKRLAETKVTVTLDGKTMADAARMLGELGGVNISVDPRTLADTTLFDADGRAPQPRAPLPGLPARGNYYHAPLKDVLNRLAQTYRVRVLIADELVLLTDRAEAEPMVVRWMSPGWDAIQFPAVRLTADFAGTPMEKVVAQLSELSGKRVRLRLWDRALAQRPVTFSARDMSLVNWLRWMARLNNLTLESGPALTDVYDAEEIAVLRRLHATRVPLDVTDKPVREVLDTLARAAGVNIILVEHAPFNGTPARDMRVTMKRDGETVYNLLHEIFNQPRIIDGAVYIVRGDPAETRQGNRRQLADTQSIKVTARFEEARLGDILAELDRLAGRTIEARLRNDVVLDRPTTLAATDMPLAGWLDALGRMYDLTWTAWEDRVFVINRPVRVTEDFNARPAGEIAEKIARMSGMNIVFDPRLITKDGPAPAAPVNLSLRDCEVQWAVWTLAQKVGGCAYTCGNLTIIGAECAAYTPDLTDAPADARKRLHGVRVSLDFRDTAFRDAVKSIAESSGKAVRVEVAEDRPLAAVSVRARDLGLDEAVNLLAWWADLTWTVKDGAVVLTDRAEPWEVLMPRALERRVSFTFNEQPLLEAMDFLGQLGGGIAVGADPRDVMIAEGEAPGVTLKMEDARFDDVLHRLAEQFHVKVVVADAAIVLTNHDVAPMPRPKASGAVNAALDGFVTTDAGRRLLPDLIEGLRKNTSGLPEIRADLALGDRYVNVGLVHARLRTWLNWLCRFNDLAWTVEDGAIVLRNAKKENKP